MASLMFVAGMFVAGQAPNLRVDVDLVTVPFSVSERGGAPVRGLHKEDFRILDNGQPLEIREFWQESDLPLTVAVVADVSGSQSAFVKTLRQDVARFLRQVVGARDRAMVVEVAQQAWLISDLTVSNEALEAAVDQVGTRAGRESPLLGPPCRNPSIPHACGGTALWHGLYYAAQKLKPVPGRKAIVVMSDGIDTGSDISVGKLIEMAQSAGVLVYSIKYLNRARYFSLGAAIAQAVSHGLERLSRETGGLTYSNPGKDTSDVFSQIEADLRNIYVLSITPPPAAHDGKFHKLEVSTIRPNLLVRSRTGYSLNVVP
jgi:Ca-activated chloride channel family protein